MTRFTNALLVTAAGAAALISFQGCTTTQTSARVPGGTMTVQIPNLPETGFLADYSKLALAKSTEFAVNGRKIYVAPDADLAPYSKVILEEPSFQNFQTELNINDGDKSRLARYLSETLRNKVKDRFLVVSQPGADTLRVRSAITRFVLPDFVDKESLKIADMGAMIYELEVTDSATGKVIIAMVDRAPGVRFTIAREDLSAEKEEFMNWLDGFHTQAERDAVKANTPSL